MFIRLNNYFMNLKKIKAAVHIRWCRKTRCKKTQRQQSSKQDNDFLVTKLFRDNRSSYQIQKIREYKYNKFNTIRSEYKIYGEIDIFQMYSV